MIFFFRGIRDNPLVCMKGLGTLGGAMRSGVLISLRSLTGMAREFG